MKSVDKVTDLVSKNLCDEKDKGILKDLLKIIKTVDSLNIKIENQNENKKKCKYYNRGYCKYKEQCTHSHFRTICDEFSTNGKCSNFKSCLFRHPKPCRFWTKKIEGCRRGNTCLYMHNILTIILNLLQVNIKIYLMKKKKVLALFQNQLI